MKHRKWILFRNATGIVHYMWNGEYPVLITSDEDLDDTTFELGYAWINSFARHVAEISWQTFFKELEDSRKKNFKFNGYPFVVVARGQFMEP